MWWWEETALTSTAIAKALLTLIWMINWVSSGQWRKTFPITSNFIIAGTSLPSAEIWLRNEHHLISLTPTPSKSVLSSVGLYCQVRRMLPVGMVKTQEVSHVCRLLVFRWVMAKDEGRVRRGCLGVDDDDDKIKIHKHCRRARQEQPSCQV